MPDDITALLDSVYGAADPVSSALDQAYGSETRDPAMERRLAAASVYSQRRRAAGIIDRPAASAAAQVEGTPDGYSLEHEPMTIQPLAASAMHRGTLGNLGAGIKQGFAGSVAPGGVPGLDLAEWKRKTAFDEMGKPAEGASGFIGRQVGSMAGAILNPETWPELVVGGELGGAIVRTAKPLLGRIAGAAGDGIANLVGHAISGGSQGAALAGTQEALHIPIEEWRENPIEALGRVLKATGVGAGVGAAGGAVMGRTKPVEAGGYGHAADEAGKVQWLKDEQAGFREALRNVGEDVATTPETGRAVPENRGAPFTRSLPTDDARLPDQPLGQTIADLTGAAAGEAEGRRVRSLREAYRQSKDKKSRRSPEGTKPGMGGLIIPEAIAKAAPPMLNPDEAAADGWGYREFGVNERVTSPEATRVARELNAAGGEREYAVVKAKDGFLVADRSRAANPTDRAPKADTATPDPVTAKLGKTEPVGGAGEPVVGPRVERRAENDELAGGARDNDNLDAESADSAGVHAQDTTTLSLADRIRAHAETALKIIREPKPAPEKAPRAPKATPQAPKSAPTVQPKVNRAAPPKAPEPKPKTGPKPRVEQYRVPAKIARKIGEIADRFGFSSVHEHRAGTLDEDGGMDADPSGKFTFYKELPTEIKTLIEGRPELRMQFNVSEQRQGANGADYMGRVGADRMVEEAMSRQEARTDQQIEHIRKTNPEDPEAQFWIDLHERVQASPESWKTPKQTIEKPGKIPTGTTLKIAGEEYTVVLDADGRKMLEGKNATWPGLEHFSELPADKGSVGWGDGKPVYAEGVEAPKAKAEKAKAAKPESGVFDPDNPPERSTLGPVFAVQDKAGTVHFDRAAVTHPDVVERLGLDAKDIVDGGWIKDGKYEAGWSAHYSPNKGEGPAKPAAPRQPWEMTYTDLTKTGFIAYDKDGKAFVNTRHAPGDTPNLKANHEEQVAKAIREGKPVPPEVLKDYPDLQKSKETEGTAPTDPLFDSELAKFAEELKAKGKAIRAKNQIKRGKDTGGGIDPITEVVGIAYQVAGHAIRAGDRTAKSVRAVVEALLDEVPEFKQWAADIRRIAVHIIDRAHDDSGAFDEARFKKATENMAALAEKAKTPADLADALDDSPRPEADILTSARKAMTADERKAMGLDELASPERHSWEASLHEAREKGLHEADKSMRLAAEVNAEPRALSDTETAGLVQRKAALMAEHRRVRAGLLETTDSAEIASKSAELGRIEEEFEALSTALNSSGTEKGRALNAQKLTLNQDFDLVTVKTRAKAAKGKGLSPAEVRRFETLARKLEATTAKVESLQKKLAEKQAEQAIRRRQHTPSEGRPPAAKRKATRDTLVADVARLLKAGCL